MLSQHSPLCVLLLLTCTSCTHRQTDRQTHAYIYSVWTFWPISWPVGSLVRRSVLQSAHSFFCRHTRRCFWQRGLGWGNAYILSPDSAHTHTHTHWSHNTFSPSHSKQHILALERTASPLCGSVCCTVPLCQLFYPPHQHRLSTVITAPPQPSTFPSISSSPQCC